MGQEVNFYSRTNGNPVNVYSLEQKVNYWPVVGYVNSPGINYFYPNYLTQESYVVQAAYDFTVIGMTVKLIDAPTSGKRIFILRKNYENTDIIVTINAGETYGSVEGSVYYGTSHFDLISLKEIEVGSQPKIRFAVSLVVTADVGRQPVIMGIRIPILGLFYVGTHLLFNGSGVRSDAHAGSFYSQSVNQANMFKSLISVDGYFKNLRILLSGTSEVYNPILEIYTYINNSSMWIQFLPGDLYKENTSLTQSNTAGSLNYLYNNSNVGYLPAFPTYADRTIDFFPTETTYRTYDCNIDPGGPAPTPNTFHPGVGRNEFGYADEPSAESFIVCPIAGTIRNLYVNTNDLPPEVGYPITVTIRKNFVDTSLYVTISNPSTTGNNTSDTISVSQGDILSIKVYSNNPSARPWNFTTNIRISWIFDSGYSNVTPMFLSNGGFSDNTKTGTSTPLNIYSR